MFKKDFWKYFINTFKESKWLLLRYIIVGCYLIVVGIIANRLNLQDLTYYNSILTLSYFVEMIAFGCSEGFGIFVNQHNAEPEVSKRYAKLGFYFTMLLSIVFIIGIGAMPNVILHNILSLDFEVDLTFYYLMLISMIFQSGFRYLNTLLARLQIFSFQLISSMTQCGLVGISFILLVVFKQLSLIPIAIIYILTFLIVAIFLVIYLMKNKKYSLNLFKFQKVKLARHERKTIILRAFSEVVWEIGYMFMAFFILRSNVIVYNQYCYFENALDIFNGMFFTFVKLTSVRICISIGNGQREEAYKHAKYSILAAIVIWVIYALCSMGLYVPFRNAMNIDLQATAMLPYILYVGVSLFRFVSWTMSTYILGQSEVYMNYVFWIEVVFATYWVVLYLIADIFMGSIWIIFGAILLELIVKISIDSVLIKRKKWTAKIEGAEEPQDALEQNS